MSVTDEDRDKAARLLKVSRGLARMAEDVEAVADALAAERDKARAPFLELADKAEQDGMSSSFRDFAGNPWPARIYPHDIRRAAQDQP